MKKQGMTISLGDLKKLEAQVSKELLDMKKLGILKESDKDKIRFQFDIVNHLSVSETRKIYCSDTWKFDILRGK